MAPISLELRIGADITLLKPGRTYVLRLPEGATAEQARMVADDLHTALERLPPEQRPVVWLAQGGLAIEDVTEADSDAGALWVGGPDDEASESEEE